MTVIQQPNNEENEQSKIESEKALADDILNQFELPESLANKIDEVEKKRDVNDEEEVEEKEEMPETKEEEEVEQPEEKEDEELIPKSTFQKRLDEMTREKRALELRLRRLEEQRNQQPQTKDEDTIKLEQMSESELVNLKKQTRLAQLKNASDDAMVSRLFELEDKIDNVIRSAPQRFTQNQIREFNDAVAVSAPDIPNFDKAQKDIFGLAKRIYDTAPELQKIVTGQARAWNLAVEHYKLMQEASAGKSKAAELGRQVNTLKKKVAIDGVSRKASTEPDSDEKLFRKAKNGEHKDKLNFIRKTLNTDSIIDEALSRT